jgi:predicted Zn-dependent protease with MMP-like domain
MTLAELARIAEQEVAALQAKLPGDISPLAARVAVHFDALPDAGLEHDLLGLFDGPAYGEELAVSDATPPQIFLYLENLLDYAEGDPALFREEVRLTYLHELGHYLGWDEDDLAARGLD